MKTKLDKVMDFCGPGLKLCIFDGRYSDGLVVFLAATTEAITAIENEFTGGDTEWAAIRYGLEDLGWYPLVFVETIADAIPALTAKLDKILIEGIDLAQWATRVELVGNLVERDFIWKLQGNAQALRELSPEKQEELLFDLRDCET